MQPISPKTYLISQEVRLIPSLPLEIGINQGFVAYYRGVNALVYKLVLCQGLKFMLYEAYF